MRRTNSLKENKLHYLSFGLATLASILLTVFSFSKLNSLISDYRDYEKQEKNLASIISPLEVENETLNEFLNNPNKVWYCANHTSDNCSLYYSNDECMYDTGDGIVYVCYSCSTNENFVYVESKEEHEQEFLNKINSNNSIINEQKPLLENIKQQKEEASNKMPKYQFIAIIFAPISLVLFFITFFAAKKD